MEAYQQAANLTTIGLSIANNVRDRYQHNEKEALEWQQHENEIKLADEQFEEKERLAKQIYLVDKFSEIEQHFQQLNADLLAAAKESERDMWDQRNQQFSNIVLATTIIMTGLITVLVQGVLPPGCSDFIKISYSIANSLSIGLLIICAVLSSEIVLRASSFMFNRTNKYSAGVSQAIETTKETKREIRRAYVDMSESDINEDFKNHEAEIRRYLQRRQEIIYNASQSMYEKNDSDEGLKQEAQSTSDSFSRFWRFHCRVYGHYAILVFYAGSAFLVISTMICMWAYFSRKWFCDPAAWIAVGIMSASLVICTTVVVYLRKFDEDYTSFRTSFNWRVRQDDIRVKRSVSGRVLDGMDVGHTPLGGSVRFGDS